MNIGEDGGSTKDISNSLRAQDSTASNSVQSDSAVAARNNDHDDQEDDDEEDDVIEVETGVEAHTETEAINGKKFCDNIKTTLFQQQQLSFTFYILGTQSTLVEQSQESARREVAVSSGE